MEEPVLAHRTEDGRREQLLAERVRDTTKRAAEFTAACRAQNGGMVPSIAISTPAHESANSHQGVICRYTIGTIESCIYEN